MFEVGRTEPKWSITSISKFEWQRTLIQPGRERHWRIVLQECWHKCYKCYKKDNSNYILLPSGFATVTTYSCYSYQDSTPSWSCFEPLLNIDHGLSHRGIPIPAAGRDGIQLGPSHVYKWAQRTFTAYICLPGSFTWMGLVPETCNRRQTVSYLSLIFREKACNWTIVHGYW